MHKIIIDANLWISFLIGKKLKSLENLCKNENIFIIVSQKIIEEFIDVSSREKIRKYVNQKDVGLALKVLNKFKRNIVVEDVYVPKLTDPKDLYLFSLAKAAEADFLLTGDKGLLALGKFYKTEIVSYSEFIARLGEQEQEE
ncbi:MAG: putative toxin-antitoxin system toxin component, PIN family [Fibromonadales bacterium]|nr:putative toxin-antitoxin system toxin component, PIN family [Fibromonadales bacterium]